MKPKFTPGPWKVGKRGRNKDAPIDIDITCQYSSNPQHTIVASVLDDSMLDPTAGTVPTACLIPM